MKYIKAKPISYSYNKRTYESVKAIVIHYTGISNDSAVSECRYFATGNQRQAGAHIFVDQQGKICKSVPLNRAAWSVGILFSVANGAGSYWSKLNNYNTVSIEMCDCAKKDPSKKMIKALKKTIKYIRKKCPNAKLIVRHWDVCGKLCPARMVGKNNKKWEKLLEDLGEKNTTKSTKKKESTSTKKTNTEIAKEVLAGKWGNGEIRKARLKAAGYDYATIQKIVNQLLK